MSEHTNVAEDVAELMNCGHEPDAIGAMLNDDALRDKRGPVYTNDVIFSMCEMIRADGAARQLLSDLLYYKKNSKTQRALLASIPWDRIESLVGSNE